MLTDYVVEAIGFNPWWFLDVMEPPLRAPCERYRDVLARYRRTQTNPESDEEIDTDLSLPARVTGGLKVHVPMLADLARGPGFPSLGSLGLTADRILESYVDKALMRRLLTAT